MIGTARVDRSGRIQHGRILRALRWRPGEDVSVDVVEAPAGDATALLITPTSSRSRSVADAKRSMPPRHRLTSWCRIDARGAITLPAAARSHCGIAARSTIVLVTIPAADRLIVLSPATVVGLLVEYLDPPPPGHRSGSTAPADNMPEGHQDEC